MKLFFRFFTISLGIFFWVSSATSSEIKFYIHKNTLIYDTEKAEDSTTRQIEWNDIDVLENLLKENPNIRMLQLNSIGGSISAANYFADIIIDFELDTNVDGTCESACTTIFLAGQRRTIEKGSWLGFHQSYWKPDYVKKYYESEKQKSDWEDPFEFASWLYEDTQKEILQKLQYLTERGVEPNFAIKTLKANNDDMWYPRRKELESAGVIR